MFDASLKSTGVSYTSTAALLAGAFIFSPAVLLVSRPEGYWPLSLAVAFSAVCLALAKHNRQTSSQLSVPSVVAPGK